MVSGAAISSVAKKKKVFFSLFFVNDDGQNNNMFIRNPIFFPKQFMCDSCFFVPTVTIFIVDYLKKKDTKRFSAFSSPEKVNETITIVRLNRSGSLVTVIFFLIRLPIVRFPSVYNIRISIAFPVSDFYNIPTTMLTTYYLILLLTTVWFINVDINENIYIILENA